jgi:hypothetical protein
VETVTLTQAREVVDLAVTTLGYRPTESLVAVGLLGATGTAVGPVLRADLPDLDDPANLTAMAGLLTKHAGRALIVVFTTDPRTARRTATALGAALGTACPVVEALWVSATAYGSLTCTHPGCCPPAGHPVADLDSTHLRAATVARGRVVVPDRAALLPAPADPAARGAVEAARAAFAATHRDPTGPGHEGGGSTGTRLAVQVLAAALARETTGSTAERLTGYGHLTAVLEVAPWRDAVILAVVTGATPDDPAGDAAEVLDRMLPAPGGAAPRPPLRPGAQVPAQVDLLLRAATHATGAPAAQAYAVAALLAWWAGDGARADVAATAAHRADPGNQLAALVATALRLALPPAWVPALR